MPLRSAKVLLLEDNDAHAELVALALEGLVHPPTICRFTRSEDLIHWIDRIDVSGDTLEPRFAFLDLRLHGKSGLDALARIRRSPRIGRLPVAILTSSAEASDRTEAERLGVQAYLVKPVDLDQILDFVSRSQSQPLSDPKS